MAKRQSTFELSEIDDTRKNSKSHAHSDLIDKFIWYWYEIDYQDDEEEKWVNGCLISTTLITVLIPPSKEMPEVKLENKEIYWKYSAREDTFEPFDEPMMKMKAYKKNTNIWPKFGEYEEMDI